MLLQEGIELDEYKKLIHNLHTERVHKLLEFLKTDPSDVFTIYALALEYSSSGDDEALKYFDLLLDDHPDYLPTYYHAGLAFAERDQTEKAIEIFKQGIELATAQKEQKTELELRNVLQNLLYEDE